MLPTVLAICATAGRHTCLERSLKLFLNQDYEGNSILLIFNNSEVPQALHLPEKPENKRVILVNSDLNDTTGRNYTSLGEIYTEAFKLNDFLKCDLTIFWDDDDIFLPNHISEGVKGYLKAKELGFIAYKPEYSYYRDRLGVHLAMNTLEPSIFVESSHIKTYGFSPTTSDQHHQWLSPLQTDNKLFVDKEGLATLVYNWGDANIPTFKTSGDPYNLNNFSNYRQFSQDHGDGIVQPVSDAVVNRYYSQVERFKVPH